MLTFLAYKVIKIYEKLLSIILNVIKRKPANITHSVPNLTCCSDVLAQILNQIILHGAELCQLSNIYLKLKKNR